jgi:hypothetical protein
MPTTAVTVTLESSRGTVTTAPGSLQRFTPLQRIVRSGVILVAGIGAAALLIPIPIIHFIGIPLVLLTSLVTAVRQATTLVRLQALRLPCPSCGARNSVGGGLGYRSATEPIDLNCDSCRRGLTLRIRES